MKQKQKAMHYKMKKKTEFSKKIYIFNIVFVICVVLISLALITLSGRLGLSDLSPLSVICTSSFGLLGVANIFYFRKAQAENVIKISKQIQNENIDVQNVEIANRVMNSDFSSM